MSIVALRNIRKVYGEKVAVEGLSLTIQPGTMFGLLGPNGSGKTSSIRMMIGITVPDSGTVELFGQAFGREQLKRIGYLPEERGLYKKMNVLDQLMFLGQLHGLSAATARERSLAWCERMEITEAIPKKTEDLSKGMQQKIQFIAALLHDPDLVIMDEPFSGLDPVNATLLQDTLVELKRAGKAILFSTHRMDQVEKMCDEIALIHRGRMVLSGNMREVKAKYPRNRLAIHFTGDERFLGHWSVEHAKNYGGLAEITLKSVAGKEPDGQPLLQAAMASGTRISRFEVREPTLEEIFIESVGERSMHNAWLIAKREYLERIRTRAFLISTILIPLLMGGFVFGSAFLTKKTKSSSHLVIVTKDTQLAFDLQAQLLKGKGSEMTVETMAPGGSVRDTLDRELDDHSIDGYLWITPGKTESDRPAFDYKPRSKADIATSSILSESLRTVLMRERLTHQGMVASDVDGILAPVKIDTSNADGGRKGGNTSFAVAYVLFFLMYMVVMLYGMNVARSIIEEKSSRVFEVLLSTIRPEEILAGKIVGVGSVGLTQVSIWMVAAIVLAATPLAESLGNGDFSFSISPVQTVFFVLYFIFGFLLYSSMAAALGAMTNSEQELQQLNMFLVIPLAFCMLMLGVVVNSPNGTWSRVVSLIPFCSPLLMNFRVSLAMPAAWEIALSFLLMGLTIFAILWLASRIYRVGILMYGKKPTLPEILRWVKYS